MNRTWRFSDLGFALLCEDHGPGELPAPLVFTSRTALAEDYEVEKAEVRKRVRERLNRDLVSIMDALSAPDLVIAVHAWNEQDFDSAPDHIRVHAVRNRTRGYVVSQVPGETAWHSGGFTVTECDPHAVVDTVFDLLPPAESGRMADAVVSTPASPAAHDHSSTGTRIYDDGRYGSGEIARGRAFLGYPATCTGIVEVWKGRSRYGPRGRFEAGLRWRDLPGDGRYAITLAALPLVVRAMSSKRMAEWVHDHAERIRTDMSLNREYED